MTKHAGTHALQDDPHPRLCQLLIVPVDERVVNVPMHLVLLFKVVTKLEAVHASNPLQLSLDHIPPAFVELGVLEVERAKLVGSLEDMRHLVIEDLIPEEDAEVVLDQIVFYMQTIPALGLAIVFERARMR